ncbi:hypothetical protein HII31_02031 [Pseudocercospora fuligena]|uniref:Gem-associated protein 5 TPR domain-containing protein n=1 Tax=Pseudocercospora fuligena TaxID=685502 RepID=A0A8H6RT48_9PEZI|nr:hypothetical protein HII31_02031 [Pseudocercospora fuligena]
MSSRRASDTRSKSGRSSSASNPASYRQTQARQTPPPVTLTPEGQGNDLEPCAATASFLLYAQRNVILVLHHDTLSIERRFDLHREDVLWIAVDNVSERGSGRLAVSFDAGKTAIVWDILSGVEIARFSAYEHMRVAAFMRNGNIAFGNDQGNVILFEPSTSEHISARTIFDPITAIAPSADCRTFAIGYFNGSILIATLQPSFTILHTLNTTRAPSKISGLAWHGSSSKQQTDMLATQAQDGDLRVWSVPKGDHGAAPTIIRVLQRPESQLAGPCWFAWSKNGRLIQLADGETRAWDVRTKKVTYDIIPTIQGVAGMANYGPTATLFTLGRNHTVQQYDINPNTSPLQVATAQHAPANTPPTPPTDLLNERTKNAATEGQISLPVVFTDGESSADEGATMSPLQRIALEMDSLDAMESEIRDKIMPLSPSSHGGSVSSRSSGKASRRQRKYLYDKPDSSRASTTSGYEGTEFSFGGPSQVGRESMSIRSSTSYTSGTHHGRRSSNLRKEVLRSPEETKDTQLMELFPYTKARLREVAFRTPHYGEVARTPDLLQREMLSVVFGWNDDARSLIHEELAGQRPGSASAVLLSKWLGDIGADEMASLVGSESMTSSDWMLLALSSIGSDSKKKVGEAFVQRLLEKGDIHPAVAILLGLGEHNDAIEVYVSQGYFMEAVLLTCLTCSNDWGRISHLLRKWGENAVMNNEAELAVRCFSCTSIQTSAPWTSPRAQNEVFAAQQAREPQSAVDLSSPVSIPSRSGSGSARLTTKNASLKLITTFGDRGVPLQTGAGADPLTVVDPGTVTAGVTPIQHSAYPMSPGGLDPWRRRDGRMARDATSARTATPGGMRRKRLPSRTDIERAKQEAAEMATPLTAARDFAPQRTQSRTSSRRTSSVSSASLPEPTTALRPAVYDAEKLAPRAFGDTAEHLPSPAKGVFTRLREESRQRNTSRERKPDHLAVQVMDTVYAEARSPMTAGAVISPGGALQSGTLSPPLTGGSSKASAKGRSTDDKISSVEEARIARRNERAESRRRGESKRRTESRSGRTSSRMRDASENLGRGTPRYIPPAKRSPSSPVPMSPEEIAQATNKSKEVEPATTDDENFYKAALSPTGSHRSGRDSTRHDSTGNIADTVPQPLRSSGRAHTRPHSPERTDDPEERGRGRSENRVTGSSTRSPSSPLPVLSAKTYGGDREETQSDGQQRFRMRSQSASRQAHTDLQSRRQASRARSSSRRPKPEIPTIAESEVTNIVSEEQASQTSQNTDSSVANARPRTLSRKELAAKELEERRRSLARRPSAPAIPLPEHLSSSNNRPGLPRSHTELGDSPTSYMPPMSRSHTVDPDAMLKYNQQSKITGTSTPSAPIGLPATPRAMRHPRYMSTDPNERDAAPPVPFIPDKFSDLGSLSGSSLSQVTTSELSQASSVMTSSDQQKIFSSGESRSLVSESSDSVGPLLPSSVYGQKGPITRAATAPPEQHQAAHPLYRAGIPSTRRLSNVRKISPPDGLNSSEGGESMSSIDAALIGGSDTSNVIIIPEMPELAPPMLPELQHLNIPPPPPPPPVFPGHQANNSSGMINIAIDENAPTSGMESSGPTLPAPMSRDQPRSATASPTSHRRNAPSGDGFSSRMRNFGERMRSSSKNRTKSPPLDTSWRPAPYESVKTGYDYHPKSAQPGGPAPYESIPGPPSSHGHKRAESLTHATHRAQSPYEQAMAGQAVSPSTERINETTIPPSSLPGSRSGSVSGYRNPKEIRANMPPNQIQHGVYPRDGGFL